jgi:hypothetical protein
MGGQSDIYCLCLEDNVIVNVLGNWIVLSSLTAIALTCRFDGFHNEFTSSYDAGCEISRRVGELYLNPFYSLTSHV